MEEQQLSGSDLGQKVFGMRNWGRWGPQDQLGAVNLITPETIVAAARLVQHGVSVSLSRDVPTSPAANNPRPAEFYTETIHLEENLQGAIDYLGISCHGTAGTHMDALCHLWNEDGMWNGRDPRKEVEASGVRWAGIENLGRGVVGRGVLLDIAALREPGFVEIGQPVTADELERAAEKASLTLKPGDILIINSGRQAWEDRHGRRWGASVPGAEVARPGLGPSCLDFLREVDCSALAWDMMDASPNVYGVNTTVHWALFSLGVTLIDNVALVELVTTCREYGRFEFLFVAVPLVLVGGTGSPVNPLAVF